MLVFICLLLMVNKVTDFGLTFLCRRHAVIWMLTNIRFGDGIMTFCGYGSG